MTGSIKVSRKVEGGEKLIGVMSLDSEKDQAKQINNFCYGHGIVPQKEIIVVEEVKSWADFIPKGDNN